VESADLVSTWVVLGARSGRQDAAEGNNQEPGSSSSSSNPHFPTLCAPARVLRHCARVDSPLECGGAWWLDCHCFLRPGRQRATGGSVGGCVQRRRTNNENHDNRRENAYRCTQSSVKQRLMRIVTSARSAERNPMREAHESRWTTPHMQRLRHFTTSLRCWYSRRPHPSSPPTAINSRHRQASLIGFAQQAPIHVRLPAISHVWRRTRIAAVQATRRSLGCVTHSILPRQ
jgi:hypothetical protein